MAKKRGDVNSQKIKLLKLMDLLHRTSEHYSLSTEEIRSRLENIYANVDHTAAADGKEAEFNGKRVGIACHRHTLAKDIETLCKYGYDVENTGLKERESTLTDEEREDIERWNIKRSRANRYYMPLGDRFSNAELRLLELALQASKMLDDESKEAIVHKLRSQTLDSHVYGFLENAFVAGEENLEEVGKGSIVAAPQNRRYFLRADGECLEVGDTCREFVCASPDAMKLDLFENIMAPIEEAMLSGSLLRLCLYDRDVTGGNVVRNDGAYPCRYEVFPLSLVYSDGKTYLLTISKEQMRKCPAEAIATGQVDEYIYPIRLDSIYSPSLPRTNFQDYDNEELDVEVVPQVKSITRKGLKSTGAPKSTRKTNASQERENTLANVLRIKRWLAQKENFDQLMRRNPHMYFERHPERGVSEYTLEFRKKDYGVWRSLRDQFGSMVSLLPLEENSEYCRAKVSVYSLRLFALWLAGFAEVNQEKKSVDSKIRIVDMDEELRTALINLHTQCLQQIYGELGAKEVILNSINDDPSFDIREFVLQLVKSFTDNGSNSRKMGELRDALLDCLAWLH
ncbi:MAG: hypothetical protein Q4F00_01480 [bacterium]|nr:hypothetical protein [bacterium]